MFSNTLQRSRGRGRGVARPQGARCDARRPRAGPFAILLEEEVQLTCEICDRKMESLDLYYDHMLFDTDHKANAKRILAERTHKPNPSSTGDSPLASPPEPSQSAPTHPLAALERHTRYAVLPFQPTSYPNHYSSKSDGPRPPLP